MLTGDKILANPAPDSKDGTASRWLAAMLLLLCATAVALLVTSGPP
jgi:hypothetical protein